MKQFYLFKSLINSTLSSINFFPKKSYRILTIGIFLLLGITPLLQATQFDWVGGTGNWTTASNWDCNSCGEYPGENSNTDTVVINSGTVTLNDTLAIDDLTLNSTLAGKGDLTVTTNMFWTSGDLELPLRLVGFGQFDILGAVDLRDTLFIEDGALVFHFLGEIVLQSGSNIHNNGIYEMDFDSKIRFNGNYTFDNLDNSALILHVKTPFAGSGGTITIAADENADLIPGRMLVDNFINGTAFDCKVINNGTIEHGFGFGTKLDFNQHFTQNGLLNLTNGDTLEVGNSIFNQPLTIDNSQTLVTNSGTMTLNAPLIIDGVFDKFNSGTLNGTSDMTINGTMNWEAGNVSISTITTETSVLNIMIPNTATLTKPLILNGITNHISGQLLLQFGGNITNDSTYNLSGGDIRFFLSQTFENNDSLIVSFDGDAFLDANGILNNNSTGVFAKIGNGGMTTLQSKFINSGLLAGIDALNFQNTFTQNGIISPGLSSISELTINKLDNTYGIIEIEIQDHNLPPGQGYDFLKIDGNATLGGTLNITELTPIPNGKYPFLVTTGTFSGTFATLNAPSIYSVFYNATSDTAFLQVTHPPCEGNIYLEPYNFCTPPFGEAMENDTLHLVYIPQNGFGPYDITINGNLYEKVQPFFPFDTLIEGIDFMGIAPYTDSFFLETVIDSSGFCSDNLSGEIDTSTITIYEEFAVILTSDAINNESCWKDTVEFTATFSGGFISFCPPQYYYTFFIDDNENGMLDSGEERETGSTFNNTATWKVDSIKHSEKVMVQLNSFCSSCRTFYSNPLPFTVYNCIEPSMVVIPTDTICSNWIAGFSATPSGQANYEFFVDANNNGELDMGESRQSGPFDAWDLDSLPGEYLIRVAVTSNPIPDIAISGTYITDSINLVVLPAPTITLTSSDADSAICFGDEITFTATSDIATNYLFFSDFDKNGRPDPVEILQDGANNIYTTDTLFFSTNIIVIATADNGCSASSDTLPIIVHREPLVSLLPNFPTICQGDTVEIIAVVAPPSIPILFEFFNDIDNDSLIGSGELLFTSSMPLYKSDSLVDGDSIRVQMTNLDGCIAVSDPAIITILDTFYTEETYDGCQGDGYSVVVNSNTYDETTPTGTEVLTAANGCDSTVTITLVYKPNASGSETYDGCQGDGYSITVNSNIYDETTPTGTEVLTAANGCDSTVTITLVYKPNAIGSETYDGCQGDGYSVVVNSNTYDETTPTGTEVLTAANGCDSTVTITLVYKPNAIGSETYDGCQGDGYLVVVNNNTYDETIPTGTEVLTAANGCDSTVTITLVYKPNAIGSETYDGCQGDGYSVVVNSNTYNENTPTGTEVLTAANGCDSTVTINLNFKTINQSLAYSGTPNFTTSLVSPTVGSPFTNFRFEVKHTDVNGNLPQAGYPRLQLDYEGNELLTDPNDRVFVLSELDINDTDPTDGKIYFVETSNLPIGIDWKIAVQSIDENACPITFGAFDELDVLDAVNLSVFASDITFSNPSPDTSDILDVFVTIHNNTLKDATNFVASLKNNFDGTVYPIKTNLNLSANSDTTLIWTITTPATAAFVPLEVFVDSTNVLAEPNELDNKALRPFINGDFNLNATIEVTANLHPAQTYPNGFINISGQAVYDNLAVPLQDSSVAGATVEVILVETADTFWTTTNNAGEFYLSLRAPTALGTYNFTGAVTDFTLIGNFQQNLTVEVIEPPVINLPDLAIDNITFPNQLIAGNTASGSITVKNIGNVATTSTTVLFVDIPKGTPNSATFTVPILNPNATHTVNLNNILFSTEGPTFIWAQADFENTEVEISENQNNSSHSINVLSPLPDLLMGAINNSNPAYVCVPEQFGLSVSNIGGAASSAFELEIITMDGNTEINRETFQVAGLAAQSTYTMNYFPSTPIDATYTLIAIVDPQELITEGTETNNLKTHFFTALPCENDLSVADCNTTTVTSFESSAPDSILVKSVVRNSGLNAISSDISVAFTIADTLYHDTIFGGLTVNSFDTVFVKVPTPGRTNTTFSILVDPDSLLVESNEFNNAFMGNLCRDLTLTNSCQSNNFWGGNPSIVGASLNFSIGVSNLGYYSVDSALVKFEISGPGITGWLDLGTATSGRINKPCSCPGLAVLPFPYTFAQEGTYQVRMTADIDNQYEECDESNNELIVNLEVANIPDYRILSQYIAPNELNPELNEAISLNITYENLGQDGLDSLELKVLIDDIAHDSLRVPNLLNNTLHTVAIPKTWSSTIAGGHVIRAIIDADEEIIEYNENNNEATRAIIVGAAPNLSFVSFAPDNLTPNIGDTIMISATIQNEGNQNSVADYMLYYVDNNGDSIQIDSSQIAISGTSSENIIYSWVVTDAFTTLIGAISNSMPMEYDETDNYVEAILNPFIIKLSTTAATCEDATDGSATASPIGGTAPFNYTWNNGETIQTITNLAVGQYIAIVSDSDGNVATDTIVVDFEDLINPIAVCKDTSLYLDANGQLSFTVAAINNGSTDNCVLDTLYLDIDNFNCGQVGNQSVKLYAQDESGNLDSCTAIVTVLDTIAPIPVCRDTTIYLDGVGNATLTANMLDNGSNDACGIANLTLSKTNFDCNNVGTNGVYLTVTDVNGNKDSCMANVTLLDTINPIAICKDTTIYVDANGSANLTENMVDNGSNDACGIANLTLSKTNFDCNNLGANEVKLFVTDPSGNMDSCTTTITVLDTIAPIALCKDTTVYLLGTSKAVFMQDLDAGSSDNCGNVFFDSQPVFLNCNNIGENIISNTIFDGNNNQATCMSTVTLIDTLSPVMYCKTIDVYLDASGTASITVDDIDSSEGDDFSTRDNCELDTVTISQMDFDCSHLGVNQITQIAIDVNGNENSCIAMVTVLDTFPRMSSLDATICQGDSYSFNNQELTIGGIFLDTIQNANQCDSILELTLTVEECGGICTESHLVLNDNPIEKGTYHAIDTLSSAGVLALDTITFKAGETIILKPGFEAPAGSEFLATLESCPASLEEENDSTESRNSRLNGIAPLSEMVDLQVFPNPFNITATIQFELPEDTHTQISLYNLNGQLVNNLMPNSYKDKGQHQLKLNADNLPKGIYFLTLQTATARITKKLFIQ